MMRIVQSSLCSTNSWRDYSCRFWVFTGLFSTSGTLSSSAPRETLFHRLLSVSDPRVSILPILNLWIEEGKSIDQKDLQRTIKKFRKFRRFKHALELSEWISSNELFDLSPGDIAVRLDLLSKVHGLKKAEEFFNKLPSSFKGLQVYGALLNSYAEARSVEKAEAIWQRMRDLGHVGTLNCNVMLHLYSKMGKHENFVAVLQEMQEKSIPFDKFTFSIQLNAHASASEIEKMETLVKKMEADPTITMDWNAYAVAAKGFLKANMRDSAFEMMKKCESVVEIQKRADAYDTLLTLYASMGKKDDVYRIWDLHKSTGKFYNMIYLCMISSLTKLDDLDGAEKILIEWEAKCKNFDFRVPNLLIYAYCTKDLMEKAQRIIDRFLERGNEFSASTWSCMARGYCRNNQMEMAVEAMKKSILSSQREWTLDLWTLRTCLEYLQEEEIEIADELMRLVEKKGLLTETVQDIFAKFINIEHSGETDQTLETEGIHL